MMFFFSQLLEDNAVLVPQAVNASFVILSSTSVFMMLYCVFSKPYKMMKLSHRKR
jgi:hypothetical protein